MKGVAAFIYICLITCLYFMPLYSMPLRLVSWSGDFLISFPTLEIILVLVHFFINRSICNFMLTGIFSYNLHLANLYALLYPLILKAIFVLVLNQPFFFSINEINRQHIVPMLIVFALSLTLMLIVLSKDANLIKSKDGKVVGHKLYYTKVPAEVLEIKRTHIKLKEAIVFFISFLLFISIFVLSFIHK